MSTVEQALDKLAHTALRIKAERDLLSVALSNLLNCVDGIHDAEWLERCKRDAHVALTLSKGMTS